MDTAALGELIKQAIILLVTFLVGLAALEALEVKRYTPSIIAYLESQVTAANERRIQLVLQDAYHYAERAGYLAKLKQAVLDKKGVFIDFAQAEFDQLGLQVDAADLERKLEVVWTENNYDKLYPVPTPAPAA